MYAIRSYYESGEYWFMNLTQGDYEVCEVLQDGWIQTEPAVLGVEDCYDVTINSGTNATDRDFGNFELGQIHGIKYNDLDGNGTMDGEDYVLGNWTITLNGTDTITNTTVSMQMNTTENGEYWFMNLTQGDYEVS